MITIDMYVTVAYDAEGNVLNSRKGEKKSYYYGPAHPNPKLHKTLSGAKNCGREWFEHRGAAKVEILRATNIETATVLSVDLADFKQKGWK